MYSDFETRTRSLRFALLSISKNARAGIYLCSRIMNTFLQHMAMS